MDWLVLDFAREHQIDLRRDRMALQRLRDAAGARSVSSQVAEKRDQSTFHHLDRWK